MCLVLQMAQRTLHEAGRPVCVCDGLVGSSVQVAEGLDAPLGVAAEAAARLPAAPPGAFCLESWHSNDRRAQPAMQRASPDDAAAAPAASLQPEHQLMLGAC